MIWSYLKAIGSCTKETNVESNVGLPKEVVEYIRTTYPDPPSDNRVIVVDVSVKDYGRKIEKLLQAFESKSLQFREKYQNMDSRALRKGANPAGDQLSNDLLAIIPDGFYQELGKTFTTNIIDYSSEIALRSLRGEMIGFSVFKSITHFAKCKPKEGITDLPLWKIRLQKYDWNNLEIKEFMTFVPNNVEMNGIDWDADGSAILKYVASDVLRRAINTTLASTSFKPKFYPVCFRLDGKWPSEYPEFVDYYMKQIGTKSTGTCIVCGKTDVSVEKLPTSQVGFFSNDQWSTQLKFSADIPSACKQCVADVKTGFTYVKKNLRFFIASRGKKKKPFEMYILPYSTDEAFLKSVLYGIADIRNAKPTSMRSAYMDPRTAALQRGRTVALLEQTSKDNVSRYSTAVDKKKEERSGRTQPFTDAFETPRDDSMVTDEVSNADRAEYIEALMYPSLIEDKQVMCLSYMIVIFTHPEGMASNFHNVLDVILAEGKSLKQLGNAIKQVTERYGVNPAKLMSLSHVMNEYYYPKFLSDLLRMKPISREIFYRNTYSQTKQGFLQSIKTVGREETAAATRMNDGRWTSKNMFLLEMTNSLMEALNLWK